MKLFKLALPPIHRTSSILICSGTIRDNSFPGQVKGKIWMECGVRPPGGGAIYFMTVNECSRFITDCKSRVSQLSKACR